MTGPPVRVAGSDQAWSAGGAAGSLHRAAQSTPGGTSTTQATAVAQDACRERLPDTVLAELTTVGALRSIGPRLATPVATPLDRYAGSTPATLCLVPARSGDYAAVALIDGDEHTYIRWNQNVSDVLARPI